MVVNEIASIHAKEAARFMSDMINSKGGGLKEALVYVRDKKETLDWLGLTPPKGASPLTSQELDVAKVITDFVNPIIPIEKTTTNVVNNKENGDIATRSEQDIMRKSDRVIYGWADNKGKIHLTPEGFENPETKIHEYDHLRWHLYDIPFYHILHQQISFILTETTHIQVGLNPTTTSLNQYNHLKPCITKFNQH